MKEIYRMARHHLGYGFCGYVRDTLRLMRSLRKRKLLGALLLVGFGTALVTTFGLVQLHDEILKTSSEQRDQAIQGWVHGFATPMLTVAMRALSWIGSPYMLAPSVTLAAGLWWWTRQKDDAMLVAAAALGGVALDEVMKLHFKRLRPDVPWAFVHEHSFSFPSGHSVMAMVMYGIIVYKTQDKLHSKWAKVALMVGAFLMVAGIGVSRVYLGVHYPSDVAGGYFVGTVWLAAVISSDLWVDGQDASSR
jgi:membrane-associated phospholipid phosphatase